MFPSKLSFCTVSTLGSQSHTIFLFLRDGKLRVEGHFWMSYLPSSLSLDGFCSPLKKWTTPTSGFGTCTSGAHFCARWKNMEKQCQVMGWRYPLFVWLRMICISPSMLIMLGNEGNHLNIFFKFENWVKLPHRMANRGHGPCFSRNLPLDDEISTHGNGNG